MSGRGGRGRGRGRGGPPSGARLLLQRSAKEAGLDDGNLRSLQDITKPSLFPDYEWHSDGTVGHGILEPTPVASVSSLSVGNNFVSTAAAAATVTPSSSGLEKRSELLVVAKPKRSPSAIYLINKSREIHHRFQSSAFYVHPTQEDDVIRYGKERQRQQQRSDLLILKQMGNTADASYIPPELLRDDDLESVYGHDDSNYKKRSLDDLAEEERAERRKRGLLTGDTKIDDDGNLSDNLQDAVEEEEEEDVDYGTNYYASDDEGDDTRGGGSGDEAVF